MKKTNLSLLLATVLLAAPACSHMNQKTYRTSALPSSVLREETRAWPPPSKDVEQMDVYRGENLVYSRIQWMKNEDRPEPVSLQKFFHNSKLILSIEKSAVGESAVSQSNSRIGVYLVHPMRAEAKPLVLVWDMKTQVLIERYEQDSTGFFYPIDGWYYDGCRRDPLMRYAWAEKHIPYRSDNADRKRISESEALRIGVEHIYATWETRFVKRNEPFTAKFGDDLWWVIGTQDENAGSGPYMAAIDPRNGKVITTLFAQTRSDIEEWSKRKQKESNKTQEGIGDSAEPSE